MSLSRPREALAEQSSFVGYLVAVAGIGRTVRTLAVDPAPGCPERTCDSDDFLYLLLGLAGLGSTVERLGEDAWRHHSSPPESVSRLATRWLR
jgi:hypothetical protein